MKKLSAKSAAAQTDRFLIGGGFFVFAIAILWALFFVPMNMDEAGIYHLLACRAYPFAPLNTFREACGTQNDLMLPFGLHIAHSEFYTGIWHSVLYAPFYFLFHTSGAQYAFNLCFLLAFAALLARATAKPLLSFALVLAFFPFVFQFVHDTGPVTYAMLMFPLSAVFLKKIMDASPTRYFYAAVWAFLVLAAIEEKPFFVYLLPSLGFFALALTVKDKNFGDGMARLKKARGALLTGAFLLITGTLLLFFSTSRNGDFYIVWLTALTQRALPVGSWFGSFADFLLYWPSYARYTFDLAGNSLTQLLFSLAVVGFFLAGLAAAIFLLRRNAARKLRWIFLGLSFLSSAVIFLVLRNTWAGHHFVFLWVPLIVLFADLAASLAPGPALGLVSAFLVLNLWSIGALTQAPLQIRNAGERAAIFRFFADDARASQSIIDFSSWGGYYIQSLYGPKNQLVTYTEPYDQQLLDNLPLMPEDARRLLSLAHKTGRRLYVICTGAACNKMALDAVFKDAVAFEDALPGLQNWRVFAAGPRH